MTDSKLNEGPGLKEAGISVFEDTDLTDTQQQQSHRELRNCQLAPSGIRTRNPNKRAAVDPRLKPRGNWDRLMM